MSLPTLVPPLIAGTEVVHLDGTTFGILVFLEVDFGLFPLSVAVVPLGYRMQAVLPVPLGLGSRVRVASVIGPPVPGGPRGPWHAVQTPAPVRPPTLPPFLDPRAGSVEVLGAFPGARVQVRQPVAGVIGEGYADPTGRAVLSLTAPLDPGSDVEAGQAGVAGLAWGTPVSRFAALSWQTLTVVPPHVGQRGVLVSRATAGSEVTVSASPSGVTGSAWAASGSLDVPLDGALASGDTLTLSQGFPGGAAGPTTAASVATEAPAVAIVGPVYAGVQRLRLRGLVPGMVITVGSRLAPGAPPVLLVDPVPVSFGEWVDVPAQTLGSEVQVAWALGPASGRTGWAPVVAVPAELRELLILPNPFDCGLAVQVLSTPGAEITVLEDGALVGFARVDSELGNVPVPTVPLRSGTTLTARQVLPQDERLSDPIPVRSEAVPVQPRPMVPIAPGDPHVWVSAVTPGAVVWVQSVDGQVLGWTVAADPVVRVPTVGVPAAPVVARALLCDEGPVSLPVSPQPDPGTPGPWRVGEQRLELEVVGAGTAGAAVVTGQVYFPLDPATGLLDPALLSPLVVVGHGQDPRSDGFVEEGYLGYGYLGRQLASYGMVVFSGQGEELGFSEYLGVIDRLRGGDPVLLADGQDLAPAVQGTPVALVGHSLGGAYAIGAVFQDQVDGAGRGLAALVLISPNNRDAVLMVPGAIRLPMLTVTGTYDYLLNPGQAFLVAGYRPSVGVLFHRGTHSAYNTAWMDWLDANPEPTEAEQTYPDIADPAQIRDATRDVAVAFLQAVLAGDGRWMSWLDGPNRPASVRRVNPWIQVLSRYGPEARTGARWLTGGPLVVDNFGDDDPQLFPLGTPGGPPPPAVLLPEFLLTPAGAQAKNTLRWKTGLHTASTSAIQAIWNIFSVTGLFLLPRAPDDRYWSRLVAPGGPRVVGLTGRDRLRLRAVTPFSATFWTNGYPDVVRGPVDGVVGVIDESGRAAAVRIASMSTIGFQIPLRPGVSAQHPIDDWVPVASLLIPTDAMVAVEPQLDLARLERIELSGWSRPDLPLWLSTIEFDSEG